MAPTERRWLVRRPTELLDLEQLAAEAGLHPQLVRRLLGLGLIEPGGGSETAPLFRRADALLLARAVRLRRDLGLNYAGAVLACELLARIEEAESTMRGRTPTRQPRHEVITWTQTG